MQEKNNLTISEMLSRAFYMCKDNILEILKALGVYIIPSIIIPIIASIALFSSLFFSLSFSVATEFEELFIPAIGVGSILGFLIITIIVCLIGGFGNLVIGKILDDGNKGNFVSWKSATKYIWDKKWSALGLNILIFLMFSAFFIVVVFLAILLSIITLGFGAIIIVPLVIAIFFVIGQLPTLMNSMLIVKDLGAIEAIGETFLLFKKGEFWKNVGILSAISGISLGVGLVLFMLEFIPILGFFITLVGSFLMNTYAFAYLNVFSLDRSNN